MHSNTPGRRRALQALLLCAVLTPSQLYSQVSRGSPHKLDRQNEAARAHEYSYLANSTEVRSFVKKGLLVHIPGNGNYELARVSFPYVRPEVKTFVERLSAQYKNACGERLVITSATRPMTHQPPNASSRSVHPTGMAIDLRKPDRSNCRRWLERTLVSLERANVLDATEEFRPPHYHVVVFPNPYRKYIQKGGKSQKSEARKLASAQGSSSKIRHTVKRGETLSEIAQMYGTSVQKLKKANRLKGSTIRAGQKLRIPTNP